MLWGVYYAALLVIEKVFLLKILERIPGVFSHIYTMLFVVIGWVLFAIEDVSVCLSYISVMFGFSGSGPVSGEALYYLRSYGPMLVIMILASTPVLKHIHQKIPRRLAGIAVPVLIVVFMVLSTAYLVDSSYNPFLYFRF